MGTSFLVSDASLFQEQQKSKVGEDLRQFHCCWSNKRGVHEVHILPMNALPFPLSDNTSHYQYYIHYYNFYIFLPLYLEASSAGKVIQRWILMCNMLWDCSLPCRTESPLMGPCRFMERFVFCSESLKILSMFLSLEVVVPVTVSIFMGVLMFLYNWSGLDFQINELGFSFFFFLIFVGIFMLFFLLFYCPFALIFVMGSRFAILSGQGRLLILYFSGNRCREVEKCFVLGSFPHIGIEASARISAGPTKLSISSVGWRIANQEEEPG